MTCPQLKLDPSGWLDNGLDRIVQDKARQKRRLDPRHVALVALRSLAETWL